MKAVLKVAVLAAALVASAAVAKDTNTTNTTVTKDSKTTTKAADGTTTTVKHHHKHVAKGNNAETSNGYWGTTSTNRYNGGTFLGYPIQAVGNPEDIRHGTNNRY